MKKSFLRQNPLVLFVLTVVAVMSSSYFVIWPWIKEIQQMRTQIAADQEELTEILLPKKEILSSLKMSGLDESIIVLEEAFPSFPNEWSLFALIESVAAESNVTLGGLSVSAGSAVAPKEIEQWGYVGLPIQVNGNDEQLILFLEKLTQAKRVIELEELLINTRRGQTDKNLELSMTVKAPYYPVPETVGAVAEPISKLSKLDREMILKANELELYGLSPVNLDESDFKVGKNNPF